MFLAIPDSTDSLLNNWWLLLVRGVAGVTTGLLTLSVPTVPLFAVVWLVGIYMIWDGLFAFMLMFMAAHERLRWWPFLGQGIVGVGAGSIAMIWPALTAMNLLYIMSGWAVALGILQVIAALRLREVMEGEPLLALSGGVSILFGLMLAARPGDGALGLLWLIAAYALAFGLIQIMLAVRMWRWQLEFQASHVRIAGNGPY